MVRPDIFPIQSFRWVAERLVDDLWFKIPTMLGITHIIYITFMSLRTVHSWKTVRGDTLTYLWVPKDLCTSKDPETQNSECSPSLEMEIVINGWHHPNFYQMLHGANSTVRLFSVPPGTWNHQVLNFNHPVCYVLSIILIAKSMSWQKGARSQTPRLSAINVFSLYSQANCSGILSALSFSLLHLLMLTISRLPFSFSPGFGHFHIIMNCDRKARWSDFQPVSPQYFISKIYNSFTSSSHTSGCQVDDASINWAWVPRRHALVLCLSMTCLSFGLLDNCLCCFVCLCFFCVCVCVCVCVVGK